MLGSIEPGFEPSSAEGLEPSNAVRRVPGVGPDAAEGQVLARPAADKPGAPGWGSLPAGRHEPSRPDGNDHRPAFIVGAGDMTPQGPWPGKSVVLQIPIKTIWVPQGRRPINRTWLPGLMKSIEAQGLLLPILVRGSKQEGKAYELVAGRHRLEACRKLGWSAIEAKVVDLDDEMAEMATIAENLWCLRLKKQEFERSLAKWEALYQARFPETMQHRAGGFAKARKSRTAAAPKAAGAEVQGGPTDIDGLDDADPCFAQVLADRLGKTRRTAERALKRSRVFRDEDHDVFEQYGVMAVHRDTIAAIVDPEQRARCIEGIGQGLDPVEVIARHMAAHRAGVKDASVVGVEEVMMSDPDWLEAYCGEFRSRLKNPKVYEADAVFYRNTDQARRAYKANVQPYLDRIGRDEGGPYRQLLWRICNVAHPKDWRVCDACKGDGVGLDGSWCRKCFSESGYLLNYDRGR